jgi:hypothetical protein
MRRCRLRRPARISRFDAPCITNTSKSPSVGDAAGVSCSQPPYVFTLATVTTAASRITTRPSTATCRVARGVSRRAVRHVAGALRAPDRDDSSVRLVWGIRALIIALTSVAFALGIVYGSRATMLLAAVVLAEELYETGVVLLVLRHHRTE